MRSTQSLHKNMLTEVLLAQQGGQLALFCFSEEACNFIS